MDEIQERTAQWFLLKPGSLFTLKGQRFFIAVRKYAKDACAAIELDPTNCEIIALGSFAHQTALTFAQMEGLRIVSVKKDDPRRRRRITHESNR